MFDRLTVGVHLIDVDTSDPRIIRIVVEEIQEIYMGPYVIAGGDNAMDDDASTGALARNLGKELSQRDGAVRDEWVVLNVCGTYELRRRLFGLLLVDHQIVE